jgi:hypothetical protein
VLACIFALMLVRREVPGLQGSLVTVVTGAAAVGVGVAVAVRRLRRGAGVVTAIVRATGLDRLAVVRGRIGALAAVDDAAAALLSQPRRLGRAAGAGILAHALVLIECHLMLAGLALPSGPLAVVATLFAAGAAHSLPVPAAVGVLEGAEMWLFGQLGYAPAVGLAVALAVRLRELTYLLPGVGYLLVRGLSVRAVDAPPARAEGG